MYDVYVHVYIYIHISIYFFFHSGLALDVPRGVEGSKILIITNERGGRLTRDPPALGGQRCYLLRNVWPSFAANTSDRGSAWVHWGMAARLKSEHGCRWASLCGEPSTHTPRLCQLPEQMGRNPRCTIPPCSFSRSPYNIVGVPFPKSRFPPVAISRVERFGDMGREKGRVAFGIFNAATGAPHLRTYSTVGKVCDHS